MAIYGLLKEDLTYRKIFPDGLVPLVNSEIFLPRNNKKDQCYRVDLDRLTVGQAKQLAGVFHAEFKENAPAWEKIFLTLTEDLFLDADYFDDIVGTDFTDVLQLTLDLQNSLDKMQSVKEE